MDTFLIEIEHNTEADTYVACYSDGANIVLSATNYHDAVLEADMLIVDDHA